MREHARRFRFCAALLALGLLATLGCNQSSAPSPGSESSAAQNSIAVIHPQKQSIKRVVEQPGMVQAYEESVLFARVPGYVRLAYDKGGRIIHDYGRVIHGPKFDSPGTKIVEPGEVLAELVVPELVQRAKLKQANVVQAESDLEQAQKAVLAAEANVAAEEAAVTEAKAYYDRWESEAKRIAKLAEGGSVDPQTHLETQNQFKAASARVQSTQAAVRKAKADLDKAAADVKSMQAHIEVAKADAAEAEAMLEYSKIRAPYDGVITARKVYSGDFVQPTQGEWLFKVARLDPVRVVVAVPEFDADLITDKSEAKLTIQSVAGPPITGTVARTSWALDAASRTLHTEIDLPNKDGQLRPGMYVYAQIINQLPDRWTLPAAAVAKQDNATAIFLVEGGKAIRTLVQVGRSDGQSVQVLKRQKPGSSTEWQDFDGGESIAAKAAGLTDGQAVQVSSSANP